MDFCDCTFALRVIVRLQLSGISAFGRERLLAPSVREPNLVPLTAEKQLLAWLGAL